MSLLAIRIIGCTAEVCANPTDSTLSGFTDQNLQPTSIRSRFPSVPWRVSGIFSIFWSSVVDKLSKITYQVLASVHLESRFWTLESGAQDHPGNIGSGSCIPAFYKTVYFWPLAIQIYTIFLSSRSSPSHLG